MRSPELDYPVWAGFPARLSDEPLCNAPRPRTDFAAWREHLIPAANTCAPILPPIFVKRRRRGFARAPAAFHHCGLWGIARPSSCGSFLASVHPHMRGEYRATGTTHSPVRVPPPPGVGVQFGMHGLLLFAVGQLNLKFPHESVQRYRFTTSPSSSVIAFLSFFSTACLGLTPVFYSLIVPVSLHHRPVPPLATASHFIRNYS